MNWLLLRDRPRGGAWNMAFDAALLEAAEAGQRVLRLYAWDPPTLSFGRHEPAARRYDRAAIAGRGLATVRRPTGGRAVWHHREVTYALAAPIGTFGSLRDTYHAIHAALADALRHLGAPVTLAADRPPGGVGSVGAGACFASAAGGEVLAPSGAKVVGSAQVRSGGAFLQHGSILLTADQSVVAELTVGRAEPPAAAGLDDLLARAPSWDEVADAVARSARRWGVPEQAAAPPEPLERRAAALEAGFAADSWTWRR